MKFGEIPTVLPRQVQARRGGVIGQFREGEGSGSVNNEENCVAVWGVYLRL